MVCCCPRPSLFRIRQILGLLTVFELCPVLYQFACDFNMVSSRLKLSQVICAFFHLRKAQSPSEVDYSIHNLSVFIDKSLRRPFDFLIVNAVSLQSQKPSINAYPLLCALIVDLRLVCLNQSELGKRLTMTPLLISRRFLRRRLLLLVMDSERCSA